MIAFMVRCLTATVDWQPTLCLICGHAGHGHLGVV